MAKYAASQAQTAVGTPSVQQNTGSGVNQPQNGPNSNPQGTGPSTGAIDLSPLEDLSVSEVPGEEDWTEKTSISVERRAFNMEGEAL